jgi:hypothetical protein
MEALIGARLSEQDDRESRLAREVFAKLELAPLVPVALPQEFSTWASRHQLTALPARPSTIAAFITAHRETDPKQLLQLVEQIADAHSSRNLADPTKTWPATFALSRLTQIKPPRSFNADAREMFYGLPPSLQQYLVQRENERDRGLHQSQQRLADAKKEIEKLVHEIKSKSETQTTQTTKDHHSAENQTALAAG